LLALAFPGLFVMNTERLDLFGPASLPEISIGPKDYAYIVYTSGSTGPPQGVIVSHENVLHFTRNHTNYMHLHGDDRATQICPLWTGASAAEIFPVLLNGACLFPYSVTEHGLSPLTHLLVAERITMFTAVPMLFRMMMAAVPQETRFPDMRMLRLAGDRTTRAELALFRKHFMKPCLLRIGLGASEVLMFAHFFIDTEYQMAGEIAPVGYALEDLELLLLDDDWNEIKAAGEYGEIAVRSQYLSVGYWKNPALTQERFIADGLDHDKRIYLSRDIGYRDEQGRLHHAGRKDARVKIYGKMYLITDVEEALLGISQVKEAVVVPFDSGARGTELAAYIVTENGYCDVAAIKQQLAVKVAAEIRPRTITILDAMPLQANNKINRLQLKDRAGSLLRAISQPMQATIACGPTSTALNCYLSPTAGT
jgi:acyl-coenzyme A synthetase/AMP-(fatty) acid ligase